ncbi:RhoGAP-domain-containing protein [Phlebopus sp. FC_14]|nr:RhoGAP-domain-containing protein [Phlebopus sp. FC_14]
MLAAPLPTNHHIPMAEQLTLNPLTAIENRLCPGCKKSAVNEGGGLVVAFGQSFFHVDCFKCAKCYQQVTADTNLLLLSDGSPICADCSYNCNICQQPILDEAIMTGDDSYHAHCFKCKVCHNRIDELVFAKTSHGIYCMNCHNERMAKIRRHAQRKREKEKAAGGSGSSSTREREAREFLGENGVLDQSHVLSPPSSVRSKASVRTFRDTPPTTSTNLPVRDPIPTTIICNRKSFSSSDEAPSAPATSVSMENAQQRQSSQSQSRSSDAGQSHSFSVTIAPPDTDHDGDNDRTILVNGNPPVIRSAPAQSIGLSQSDTATSLGYLKSPPADTGPRLSPLSAAGGIGARRKSFDDGVRPLNVLFGNKDTNQGSNDAMGEPANRTNLNIPNGSTSRSEKRRSINPGLALDHTQAPRPSTSSGYTAPEMVRSQTLPVQRSDSPVTSSPPNVLVEVPGSRRTSNASLLRDNASTSTVYRSLSSSPAPLDNGRATPDSMRMRSVSHDPNHPHSAPPFARPNTPLRPAPRPSLTLERVPQRLQSLHNEGPSLHPVNGRLSPIAPSHRVPRSDGSRSADVSSPSGWNSDTSRMPTPTSPSHSADVPHSIESGTDTEAEGDSGRKSDDNVMDIRNTNVPSKPHVNLEKGKLRPGNLKLDIDPDVSALSQLDGSDESSPVERTSIATFIAPALPPIRFSMSGADFSDFLKSVGGIPSLKSLDKIAQGEELEDVPTVPEGDRTPTATANTSINFGDAAPVLSDAVDISGKTSAPDAEIPPAISRTETPNIDAEANDLVPNLSREFTSRGRAASESLSPSLYGHGPIKRERLDSNASLNIIPSTTRITVTSSNPTPPPPVSIDSYDLVIRRLQESLADANERGAQQMRFDKGLVEAILMAMEQRRIEYIDLKAKYDGTKRASQRYMDGLTDAEKEYERELVARQNAEAEVIRLRVLLSGQAARLTALSGENNRQEARRQLSQELSRSLDQLERDLSKLRAERDVTLAEVEELCSSKSSRSVSASGEIPAAQLSRSLTMRLDNIKSQYQLELVPLTQQREALAREIAELKAAREQCLEETTVLNARNEELAQLSAQYTRRMEASRSETPSGPVAPPKGDHSFREKKSTSLDRTRPPHPEPPASMQFSISTGSVPSSITLVEDRDNKITRIPKPEISDTMSTLKHGKFKWPGSRTREHSLGSLDPNKGRGREHNFQQASVLRFTRCDHCGDKLWGGSHFRCTTCHINVHSRCVNQVHLVCSQQLSRPREETGSQLVHLPPSMFGRDLIEQVKSDSRWGERKVPVIVEKCIEAVEKIALDYEGLYRKTGGSGQTKIITQLFERGDYAAFDLRDSDRFNDICSVTSVLKTYFRSLPVPLLTFDLHGEFISAAGLKDPALKTKHLCELVDRLPSEHYHTLRLLMLHLHRVREHSDTNLMNARNLGVVFGPTLMWSRDPGSEFSDMAGKALMVEWLVENAVSIFQTQQQSSPR